MRWRALTLLAAAVLCTAASPYVGRMPAKAIDARPCARADVEGTWKLKRIFANARNKYGQAFRANPEQYLALYSDQLIARYAAKQAPAANALESALAASKKQSREQFVLNDKSGLYFYNNQKLELSTQCGIVKETRGERIRPGNMLLTVLDRPKGKELMFLYGKTAQPVAEERKPVPSSKDATGKKP